MRSTSLFSIGSGLAVVLAGTLGAACGSDSSGTTDAPPIGGDIRVDSDAAVPARVIPGGGIADGAITGVVNIYAIDDTSRTPISGATVTIGGTTGTTDSTGLFVATGLNGKQTVLITADSYRSEMWVGANGTNITIDLQKAAAATPGAATLSGKVNLSGFTVSAGHTKVVSATYSQDDLAGDAANNLDQGGANTCSVTALGANQDCAFTVTSRTGHVALIGAVFDHDPKTADPTDDTFTLIGWATRSGIVVTDGVAQTSQDLTVVAAGDLTTEDISFGTPPASLPTRVGVVGMELGAEGTIQLPSLVSPTITQLLVPKLSVFPSATYRLTGIAKASAAADVAASVVLVRAQTGSTLTAGTWLTPTTAATVTRTSASWASVDGALVQGITMSSPDAQLLSATAFDGSTTIDILAAAGIPISGTLTAQVTALAGTGIDLTDLELDRDRTKITASAALPTQVAQ